jgi:hypothetical protein
LVRPGGLKTNDRYALAHLAFLRWKEKIIFERRTVGAAECELLSG